MPSQKKRLVEKDGSVNVETSLKSHNFFNNPVGAVARWNYLQHLVVLLILCLVPWVVFALIWHFTFWIHGDLDADNLPDKQEESGWIPCVYSIHGFTSSLLFSLETQRSIGYGLRGTSHKCTDSVILEMVQSICAILIECVIGVILYIKLTRGMAISKTYIFSHNAVVALRNGKLTLMLRVMNIKKRKVKSTFTGFIVHKVTTTEGEELNHHFTKIQLSSQVNTDNNDSFAIATPVLPDIVSHTIDSSSPLYDISPDNIMAIDLEIIVSVVMVEPNGSQTMFMTSYLPDEIIWANHFVSCVEYKEEMGNFMVDVNRLNMLVPNNTPRMSAKKIYESSDAQPSAKKKNLNV